MIYTVKVKGKDSPLSFSNGALLFWAHNIGRDEVLTGDAMEFTAYEFMQLCYAALKYGMLEKFDMDIKYKYHQFVNEMYDVDLQNQVLECFKSHIDTIKKAAEFNRAVGGDANSAESEKKSGQDITSGTTTDNVLPS